MYYVVVLLGKFFPAASLVRRRVSSETLSRYSSFAYFGNYMRWDCMGLFLRSLFSLFLLAPPVPSSNLQIFGSKTPMRIVWTSGI